MPVRITDGTISTQVLNNLQRNLRNMADIQQRVSTGLRFTRPSDNPTDLSVALGFRNDLGAIRRFTRNIDRGLSQLNSTDSSLSNVGDILQRARELTVQANNGTLSSTDKLALADEVHELLNRVVESGNASLNGLFIYSGNKSDTKSFAFGASGPAGTYVRYLGDTGTREYEIAQGVTVPVNIHGLEAFFVANNKITAGAAVADTADLLVNQLPAAPPPSNADFTGTFTINGATLTVTATDSLSSIRDKINQANVDVLAEIDSSGALVLTSLRSEDFILADGTSNLMTSLGMYKHVDGGVLDPGGTLTGGVALSGLSITPQSVRITNDGVDYDIDLSAATTVTDILTAINNSGSGATAYINSAGTGIVISSTATTSDFAVEDVRHIFGQNMGGPVTNSTTLASLGIGALTSINVALGSETHAIDLSSATTVGDVLTALNSGHAGIVASINAAGNGIDIIQRDIGSTTTLQNLVISEVGAGTSGAMLGILGSSNANTASDLQVAGVGATNETASKNIFKTLMELESGLRNNGTTADYDQALDDLDSEATSLLSLRTRTGARVNRFEETQARYSREEVFLTALLSTNEDVDLAEVVTELNLQQTTLQAALSASSKVITPSLLDYLR